MTLSNYIDTVELSKVDKLGPNNKCLYFKVRLKDSLVLAQWKTSKKGPTKEVQRSNDNNRLDEFNFHSRKQTRNCLHQLPCMRLSHTSRYVPEHSCRCVSGGAVDSQRGERGGDPHATPVEPVSTAVGRVD